MRQISNNNESDRYLNLSLLTNNLLENHLPPGRVLPSVNLSNESPYFSFSESEDGSSEDEQAGNGQAGSTWKSAIKSQDNSTTFSTRSYANEQVGGTMREGSKSPVWGYIEEETDPKLTSAVLEEKIQTSHGLARLYQEFPGLIPIMRYVVASTSTIGFFWV